MKIIKYFLFLFILTTLSSCVITLNTNKTGSGAEYSEDLSNYLPEEEVDAKNISGEINELHEIDTTLIVTKRLDSALFLVNAYNDEKTSYIEGLTIQLYSGNERAKAKEAQMKAYRYYADSTPRIIFDQPNYKVRMGKFYSQLEAYPMFKDVQSRFSRAILVPTRIPVSKK